MTHSALLPPREATTQSEFCNLTVLWNWSSGIKEEDTMVIGKPESKFQVPINSDLGT